MTRSSEAARLYVEDAVLEWLTQYLKDMTPERRECIQEKRAVASQRHLGRHRHRAATDQAHLRHGLLEDAMNGRSYPLVPPQTSRITQALATLWTSGYRTPQVFRTINALGRLALANIQASVRHAHGASYTSFPPTIS